MMLILITQVQNVREKNPPVSMRNLFAGFVYKDLA